MQSAGASLIAVVHYFFTFTPDYDPWEPGGG
jgi:hypothetical protein